MNDTTMEEKLEALFRETGPAHHRAFIATDGADPECPLWYAEYLQDRVNELSSRPMTRSELVYHIIGAERERETKQPDADWPGYYARYLNGHLT